MVKCAATAIAHRQHIPHWVMQCWLIFSLLFTVYAVHELMSWVEQWCACSGVVVLQAEEGRACIGAALHWAGDFRQAVEGQQFADDFKPVSAVPSANVAHRAHSVGYYRDYSATGTQSQVTDLHSISLITVRAISFSLSVAVTVSDLISSLCIWINLSYQIIKSITVHKCTDCQGHVGYVFLFLCFKF